MGSILNRGFTETPPPSLDDWAKAFYNMWEQNSGKDYFWAIKRMDRIAKELAAHNADIITLQNDALWTNQPSGYYNGDLRRGGDIQLLASVGTKDETYPEDERAYDFSKMLIERLRNNYGQKYVILNQLFTTGEECRRGLDGYANATATVGSYLRITTLIKESIFKKACIKRQENYNYFFSREIGPARFKLDDETYWIGVDNSYGRGYVVADLKIKGQYVRILNTHLASGYDLQLFLNTEVPYEWIGNTNRYNSGAPARNVQSLELLSKEIKTSPYPVILCGDFNSESNFEEPDPFYRFPTSPYENLIGSGLLVDSGVAFLGEQTLIDSETRYKTSGLRTPTNMAEWDQLRNEDAFYSRRQDFIFFSKGKGITVKSFDVTQVTPDDPSPDVGNPFRFTAGHNGVVAELCFPNKHC